MLRGLIVIVYLAVGVYVASTHHYLGSLNSVQEIVSALLGIILWPLVLIGVNLHIGKVSKGGKGMATPLKDVKRDRAA
jgi:hypothetical protein